MAALRKQLASTSGTDAFGNDFTLQETDIQPYIDDPNRAQMEADVTKARYGGTDIYNADEVMLPYSKPDDADPDITMDFSRRGDFEKHLLKQLKSDSIPDGNPFAMNVTAKANEIAQQDLPQLFSQVFQGQVLWRDRHLMNDDQKKYWTEEAKRYRAHLDAQLRAEKQTAIDMYNHAMNRFDNQAKEVEASRARVQKRTKEFMAAQDSVRKETVARYDKLASDRNAINKQLMEIMLKHQEYANMRGGADSPEAQMVAQQYENLMNEKARLDAEINALTKKDAPGPEGKAAGASPKEPAAGASPKEGPAAEKGEAVSKPKQATYEQDGKTVVRGKAPAQAGEPRGKQIVARKILPDGRKAVEYADGTREIVEDAPPARPSPKPAKKSPAKPEKKLNEKLRSLDKTINDKIDKNIKKFIEDVKNPPKTDPYKGWRGYGKNFEKK